MAAGTVGGIMANATRPAEFIYDNLAMQLAVAHAAYQHGVRKLLMLGSSCVYPENARNRSRRVSAHRTTRADERAVRAGENCGDRHGARVSQAYNGV